MNEAFEAHKLNGDGVKKVDKVRALFDDFLSNLEIECGSDGREMAIVRTKLEEASFFANKAISVFAGNQS